MSKDRVNVFPSPNETNKKYTVNEATQILMYYGISMTDKRTRDLIAKGKLVAVHRNENNENDRRSGYLITGKAIYDCIVNHVPACRDLLKFYHASKPSKTMKKQTKETIESTEE